MEQKYWKSVRRISNAVLCCTLFCCLINIILIFRMYCHQNYVLQNSQLVIELQNLMNCMRKLFQHWVKPALRVCLQKQQRSLLILFIMFKKHLYKENGILRLIQWYQTKHYQDLWFLIVRRVNKMKLVEEKSSVEIRIRKHGRKMNNLFNTLVVFIFAK